MLADSQTYSICSENFIKIGQAVSEEYGNENCDTKILYIRRLFIPGVFSNRCLTLFNIGPWITAFCIY